MLLRISHKIRKGVSSNSSVAGTIVMMLCSNSRVKSKPPRQSRTPGPKESSMPRGQVGADMFMVEASCDMSGISGDSSARYRVDVELGNKSQMDC